jgi:RNA polymerase sigma-70 factor (ECF subfamily)
MEENQPVLAADSIFPALLRRAREGDLSAWIDLVEGPMRPYLRRVAEPYLRDRIQEKVDASDVIQEVLLVAFQKLHQFQGTTPEEWCGWLTEIVRNEALDQLRRWRQQVRSVAREQALPLDAAGGVALAADISTPSQHLARREEELLRQTALERLAPDDQEVIRLKFQLGWSWTQIAKAMGRSQTAVRRLYYRALKRWKQQVGAMG